MWLQLRTKSVFCTVCFVLCIYVSAVKHRPKMLISSQSADVDWADSTETVNVICFSWTSNYPFNCLVKFIGTTVQWLAHQFHDPVWTVLDPWLRILSHGNERSMPYCILVWWNYCHLLHVELSSSVYHRYVITCGVLQHRVSSNVNIMRLYILYKHCLYKWSFCFECIVFMTKDVFVT